MLALAELADLQAEGTRLVMRVPYQDGERCLNVMESGAVELRDCLEPTTWVLRSVTAAPGKD
jgi:hypothetical protein